MDAAVVLIAMFLGYIVAGVTLAVSRKDLADMRSSHSEEIRVRDQRIEILIDQMQANAQNLPYYPTIGPSEPVPEQRYLADEWGLNVFEDLENADIDAVVGE